MARPRPAVPCRWQRRVGGGTVKGATPDREGTSQALDAHDPPHQPGAPGKGVHERHEKPHFKLFFDARVHLFGTSRVYRWPTRAGEMNERMLAGGESSVTLRTSTRCRAGARYSASSPSRRTLQRIGVEHDGEWTVVYKLHLHVRAKRSRGNARDILACQLHEVLVELVCVR